jgi:hypothetical protein
LKIATLKFIPLRNTAAWAGYDPALTAEFQLQTDFQKVLLRCTDFRPNRHRSRNFDL